ncbi:MAG: hypothetical protein V1802_01465 [Candidatus Aenigmatarchaeota archaeon]
MYMPLFLFWPKYRWMIPSTWLEDTGNAKRLTTYIVHKNDHGGFEATQLSEFPDTYIHIAIMILMNLVDQE